jgi:hypothetical protein
MNRTWAAEVVANNSGRTVAEQLQHIGHRDHLANSPEINAWHRTVPAGSQPPEQRRGTRIFGQYVSLPRSRPSKTPEQRRGTRIFGQSPAVASSPPAAPTRNREEEPVYFGSRLRSLRRRPLLPPGTEKRNPYISAVACGRFVAARCSHPEQRRGTRIFGQLQPHGRNHSVHTYI